MKYFIFTLIITALLNIIPNETNASALVFRDEATSTLKVIARMIYSGPFLTEELAKTATKEIQELWSENPTSVNLNGKIYKVEFWIQF